MSADGRQVVPARSQARRCGVNPFGDLVCPSCGLNIITPWYFDVVPGVGKCVLCATALRVTRRIAKKANHRAAFRRAFMTERFLGGHDV
jgi:hypothetical protein